MSDGSLRITLEFDPRYAKEAYAMFGARGTAVAVAALNLDASINAAQDETIETEKPKGGALAKLAGMWCANPMFWEWIEVVNGGDGVHCEQDAAMYLYECCRIKSRAELDNDPEAADKFHKLIREPYSKWLKQCAL